MKYFLLVSVFLITACSPPEPGTDRWFEEKYEELLAADPEATLSLEEFKDIFSPNNSQQEAADNALMKKHSIAFWLMDDNFLSPDDDYDSFIPTYIRTLKQCAANFSVMYGNMEAGLLYGKTITGLDDVKEISRLSDEYMNHALYFATRAEEIQLKESNAANWDTSGNNLTYLEMLQSTISNEIALIQDEIFSMNSNEKYLELLEGNAEICIQTRNQNPNNKNYIFD
jgi:hypothetical protein